MLSHSPDGILFSSILREETGLITSGPASDIRLTPPITTFECGYAIRGNIGATQEIVLVDRCVCLKGNSGGTQQ